MNRHDPAAARQRAIGRALAFAESHTEPETGFIVTGPHNEVRERETVYAAITLLMTEDTEHARRAGAMLEGLGIIHGHFPVYVLLHVRQKMGRLLSDAIRAQIRTSLRACLDVPAEDIIAGRNTNLPLQTWAVRLAAGLEHDRPDLVDGAVQALEDLSGLVRAHGSLPEFNSPVYHAITLQTLHVIAGLAEPRTTVLAKPLLTHLWEDMAWHYHPRLRVLCGPWGRQYQDGFDGSGINTEYLMDQVWGAFHDDSVSEKYDHDHDFLYAPLLAMSAEDAPDSARGIAEKKALPLTVLSRAEQVDLQMGDAWAPGGIAELTTWMDEHRAVGSASRGHVHGMHSGVYVAHWTRNGEPVHALSELGIAFTHFVQNGRRPGTAHAYRNHHRGSTVTAGKSLWADDGRGAVLQSGPTALAVYTPKEQERRWVRRLEALMVIPRRDAVDTVLVDGEPCDHDFEGDAAKSIVVRSGLAALGLCFQACDDTLTTPQLFIERSEHHLLVGLRLVGFKEERELPLETYRRYGASIGAELRWAPRDQDVARFVDDMRTATLTDDWWMGPAPVDVGGPRKVAFTASPARRSAAATLPLPAPGSTARHQNRQGTWSASPSTEVLAKRGAVL